MLGRNACLRTRGAGLCLLFFMCVCLLDLAHATFPYFGGYEPLTDVTEHSKIDLDLIDIIGNIGGTCGAPCLLSATCPATSVAAEGTGCNYDGSTLAFPSGDHASLARTNLKMRSFPVLHATRVLTLMTSGSMDNIQIKV